MMEKLAQILSGDGSGSISAAIVNVLDPKVVDLSIVTASRARNIAYTFEAFWMGGIFHFLPIGKKPQFKLDMNLIRIMGRSEQELFQREARAIREGFYPPSVLIPENPSAHLRRIPQLLRDGISANWRRAKKATKEFSDRAREEGRGLPDYFLRTFHFQRDGYLSEESAEVYDHQVELLFRGTGDAMRRLAIPPLKKFFPKVAGSWHDGEGLQILEVAAGAGSSTRFMKQAFPRAKIVATDMSGPYLRVAQRRLKKYSGLDFVQADAAELPFKDGHFDAVYSVFLFHEVPVEERFEILRESLRVLKPGGMLVLVDSLQNGDNDVLDEILNQFPQNFHEPFYKNYIENPMERLAQAVGFQEIHRDVGHFSKVVSAIKPG